MKLHPHDEDSDKTYTNYLRNMDEKTFLENI